MTSLPPEPSNKRKRRRQATVYDAVAGRIGYESFLPTQKSTPDNDNDTPANAPLILAPEEVLFKRKNAPPRYEENDIYSQERYLDPRKGQVLPESDLLKAIHVYVSEFYAGLEGGEAGPKDCLSMEETALLALGFLVEESAETVVEGDGFGNLLGLKLGEGNG